MGRHGQLFTEVGKVNITNTKYRNNFEKITNDEKSPLYPYTWAYLSHLFHSNEMLGAILLSQHNLYFLISTVEKIRQAILDDTYLEFKKEFLTKFYGKLLS
jgi:queuine tRNA-ribosyltransferase